MTKKLVCVECPKGCILSVEIKGNKVIAVEGNECSKGEKYAYLEAGNPVRVLTSTVLADGLDIRMVPVKTDRPIPKDKLFIAMQEVKKIRLKTPVLVGDVIAKNVCGLGINLVSTRDVLKP